MTKDSIKKHLSYFIMLGVVIVLIIFVLLFAEQYTFRDGKLIQTGIIAISETEKADVYVNGERKGLSPITINFVEAGEYTVRIKKENHIDWERNVTVIAGKVTNLIPILVPQSTQTEYVGPYVAVIPSKSGQNYIAITVINNKVLLQKHSFEKGLFGIVSKQSDIAELNNLLQLPNNQTITYERVQVALTDVELIVSPSASKAILVKNTRAYLIGSGSNHKELTWFDDTPVDIKWTADEHYVVSTEKGTLVGIKVSDGLKKILTNTPYDKVVAFTPFTTSFIVFSVEDGNTLYQVDADKPVVTEIVSEGSIEEIEQIEALESTGTLFVQTNSGIWEIPKKDSRDASKSEHLSQGNMLYVDNTNGILIICNKENPKVGTLRHYGIMSPFASEKIDYPFECSAISNLLVINSGQNLVFDTASKIVMTTSDGRNIVDIPENVAHCDNPTFTLLSAYTFTTLLFLS